MAKKATKVENSSQEVLERQVVPFIKYGYFLIVVTVPIILIIFGWERCYDAWLIILNDIKPPVTQKEKEPQRISMLTEVIMFILVMGIFFFVRRLYNERIKKQAEEFLREKDILENFEYRETHKSFLKHIEKVVEIKKDAELKNARKMESERAYETETTTDFEESTETVEPFTTSDDN